LKHGTAELFFDGTAISNKYVLDFLRKVAIVSEYFIVTGNRFQTVGAAIEKTCLPILSLVEKIQSCLETDDLNILEL